MVFWWFWLSVTDTKNIFYEGSQLAMYIECHVYCIIHTHKLTHRYMYIYTHICLYIYTYVCEMKNETQWRMQMKDNGYQEWIIKSKQSEMKWLLEMTSLKPQIHLSIMYRAEPEDEVKTNMRFSFAHILQPHRTSLKE